MGVGVVDAGGRDVEDRQPLGRDGVRQVREGQDLRPPNSVICAARTVLLQVTDRVGPAGNVLGDPVALARCSHCPNGMPRARSVMSSTNPRTAAGPGRVADTGSKGAIMPIFVAHLRWNSLTAAQHSALLAMVQDESAVPACWSFTVTQDGSSLRATAVWDGNDSMRAFAGRLARTAASGGLDEPTLAVFSVPELFAAGYRPRATTAVPAPRAAAEQESTPVPV